MPLYDYACDACEFAFEVSRSFARADEPVACPLCGESAKRQLTLPLTTFTRGGYAEKARENPPSHTISGGARPGHSHGPGHHHGPGGHTH